MNVPPSLPSPDQVHIEVDTNDNDSDNDSDTDDEKQDDTGGGLMGQASPVAGNGATANSGGKSQPRRQNWKGPHERALLAAFYKSGAAPTCDENAIAEMMQSGEIESSPRMQEKIKKKWKQLPKRIRAILRNTTATDNNRKDKYGVIREYVKNYPVFFQRFR